MKTAEQAAAKIRRAYGIRVSQAPEHGNRWVGISDLWELVDLTKAELDLGIRHLDRHDAKCVVIPESNQKVLTAEQRQAAVVIGNQDNHLIGWEW